MSRALGITSLQILAAIRDGWAYGLDVVAHTGLPSGTVYTTLGRLRKSGLIRSHWEDQGTAESEGRPRRRYYELSSEGVRALAEGLSRVAALSASLDPEAVG